MVLHADDVDRSERATGVTDRLGDPRERPWRVLELQSDRGAEGRRDVRHARCRLVPTRDPNHAVRFERGDLVLGVAGLGEDLLGVLANGRRCGPERRPLVIERQR